MSTSSTIPASTSSDQSEARFTGPEQVVTDEQGDATKAGTELSGPDAEICRMFSTAFWEEGNRHGETGPGTRRGIIRAPATFHMTSDGNVSVHYMNRLSDTESIPNECLIDPSNCEIERLKNDEGTFRIVSRAGPFLKTPSKFWETIDFDTVVDHTVSDKYEKLEAIIREREEATSHPVRAMQLFTFRGETS